MARKRKAQLELEMVAGGTAAVEAQVLDDVLPVAPVDVPQVTAWRVVKTTRISLYGQMTTLAAGSSVTVASYGRAGIARIAAQVELVPVT